MVVYWNDESPVCNDHGPSDITHNQTGAVLRANFAPSDFALFELSDIPDPAFNVYYAGWDANGTTPTAAVGIHQPRGDVKAISFANSMPTIASFATDTPNTFHWRVLWNSGVTEGGSSGSCLFDTGNKRCIGQLHGGPSACGAADLHDFYGMFSVSWTGGGTNSTRLSNWLDPNNTGTMGLDGDPHMTTTNGVHYDFQSSGEFISLRDPGGLEIQTRQAPIATTFNPGVDPHDGLSTCVSLNAAVAARVGNHRITYQPNLNGVPDPSGLQLRVDGVLTTLGPTGLNFGGGGRLANTSAPGGLEIDFPDGRILFVTPGWWTSQSKWYLNVDLAPLRAIGGTPGAVPGNFRQGGIAGPVPSDSWLPALPDGTSMGPMPTSLHQRYVDLYQKFADAWRVTDSTSLFDYAPGTSTDTFTRRNSPLRVGHAIPRTIPVEPATEQVAQRACAAVKEPNAHRNWRLRRPGYRQYRLRNNLRGHAASADWHQSAHTDSASKQVRAAFLDFGAGIPHGTFSNFFNTGFSFNAGLEYMINSNLSAEGIFGYHRFPTRFGGGSANLFQFSGNAKVYVVPSPNTVRPFFNGGVGVYTFSSGTSHFGGNVGGGVLYEITPRFGVQGSYNFHTINTSGSAIKFSTVQGGVRFVFLVHTSHRSRIRRAAAPSARRVRS